MCPELANLQFLCMLKKDLLKEIMLQNNELFPQTICSSPALKKKSESNSFVLIKDFFANYCF